LNREPNSIVNLEDSLINEMRCFINEDKNVDKIKDEIDTLFEKDDHKYEFDE